MTVKNMTTKIVWHNCQLSHTPINLHNSDDFTLKTVRKSALADYFKPFYSCIPSDLTFPCVYMDYVMCYTDECEEECDALE